MIAAIRKFFGSLIEPGTTAQGEVQPHALQLATAALLAELARQDEQVDAAERRIAEEALRRQFDLSVADAEALIALAEQQAREAPGYFEFTSLINQHFSAEQKVQVVECLWRVANADGRLDSHENHFMRRIADLLHVGRADYVAAKQRARDAADG
jgi:uncharacterized tellurite resistance protein B-like protein